VNIEQKVNDWVVAIAERNAESGERWGARFVIEGFWPTVGATEDLAAIAGTIRADGPNQYALTFPPAKTREAVELVAEQGGWLCERQTPPPAK